MMCGQKSQRQCLLEELDQVSFAVDDMLLYLDTHPEDEKALAFFSDVLSRRKKLLNEFAEKYGPLLIDDASKNSADSWKWVKQPFPWEREGA